jgi:thiamine-phosphate diphosphorylase
LPVVESVALVAEVVAAGARHVQLRLKDLAEAEIGVAVAAAQAVCAQYGARLWVNDHWRAAVAHGAYGVHVGQEDLAAMGAPSVAALAASGLRLGVSTHSYAELATALGVRPSYISLGPIYATASKDVSKWGEQGLERIASWRRLVPAHVPLIAIGGISIERAPGVLAAGAEGIAVISAITKATDRAAAVREWQALWG